MMRYFIFARRHEMRRSPRALQYASGRILLTKKHCFTSYAAGDDKHYARMRMLFCILKLAFCGKSPQPAMPLPERHAPSCILKALLLYYYAGL